MYRTIVKMLHLRPERDEIRIHGDVFHHPVSKGDFADVDMLARTDGIFNGHVLELSVKESVKRLFCSYIPVHPREEEYKEPFDFAAKNKRQRYRFTV